MLEVGATVTLAAPTVRDAVGQPANVTTATLTITLPDQTTVPVTVTNPPTQLGQYTAAYVAAQPGRHVAHWTFSDGAPAQAASDVFTVADPTWPAVVGLAEARKHLRYADDDHSDDDQLRGTILCVSQVVEDITGEIAQRTHTQVCSGGAGAVLLSHLPVIEVTQVRVDGAVVDPTLWTCSPHGVLYSVAGRWPRGLRNIEVTYRAGRVGASPATIDAALELIRINWRPQLGGNYGPFDGGDSDDFGVPRAAEGALQGEIRLGFFVPNTVMQRLQPTARAPHIA